VNSKGSFTVEHSGTGKTSLFCMLSETYQRFV